MKWQRAKPYEKFAAMIERYWDGTTAFCKPEDRVPPGFVEGLVNKIRAIQRRVYGLRDTKYLHLKTLTCMLPHLRKHHFHPHDFQKPLFGSAVIKSVITVPIMVLMMKMASHRDMMGTYRTSGTLRVVSWLATIVMVVAVVGMSCFLQEAIPTYDNCQGGYGGYQYGIVPTCRAVAYIVHRSNPCTTR
ncbi:transposase [Paraburkholderia megapolitana]|uniref:transposase n=1 Tax=Paraburkholderia megapolitana TaxID=420953 RepID=UPI003898E63D